MPKIVDHDKRKEAIAEATWKIIIEKGMEGATVRNIAREAGLSLGALRHYFSSQDDLLKYAMTLVKEKATVRIEAIAMEDLAPKEKVLKMLMEMVPTNRETMAEMEVWFTFVFHFRHKKDDYLSQFDGIYAGIKKLIDFLAHSQLLKVGVNQEIEAEKLYALIDGLAIHAMLEPDRLDKNRITKSILSHLETLMRKEA